VGQKKNLVEPPVSRAVATAPVATPPVEVRTFVAPRVEVPEEVGAVVAQWAAPPVTEVTRPQAEAQVSAAPVVSPPPSLDFDEDDDLPRPGKVWDDSGPSLKELLAQQQAKASGPSNPSTSSGQGGSGTGVEDASTASPATAASDFSNVEPVRPSELGDVWQALLNLMAGHGPMLHSLLAGGSLASIDGEAVVIRYSKKNETFTKILERNGKKDLVRDGLAQILGKPVGVRFEVDESASEPEPSGPAAAGAPAPQRPPSSRPAALPEPQAPAGPPAIRITPELVEQMKQDLLVNAVMQAFNATPVKIE
jgi:hypothetical protein